ncbi:MAG: hypothetical protein V7647_658, partial [Acidobacteriota bacterium]
MFIAAYLATFAACSFYAWRAGGAPERIGVATLCAAVAASEAVSRTVHPTFLGVEWGYTLVDGLALVGFTVLACRAQRYWPMFVAAILLDQILTHLLMLSPKLMPFSYSVMLAIWSFAKPPIIAVGAWRHRRRLASLGSDP